MIGEWYCEWHLFDAVLIYVYKVSLNKPWSRRRFSMICWIFSEHFFEWRQFQFRAVSAGDSVWAAVWSDLCWHRREIDDRYFCWGDKLVVVGLKLCFDVCHISVLCNNYFYCAWPIPVSYLISQPTLDEHDCLCLSSVVVTLMGEVQYREPY